MYEKTRAEGFGPEVQRRIMVGTYVLSAGFYDAYYNRARKVRALIKRDFELAFADGIDAILTPATPSSAFGLGEMANADPVEMYLNDVFTVTVNLAGLPGISVPVGLDKKGLPMGLQLIGRPWAEADLLNHAYVLEQAAGFVAKPAKMVVTAATRFNRTGLEQMKMRAPLAVMLLCAVASCGPSLPESGPGFNDYNSYIRDRAANPQPTNLMPQAPAAPDRVFRRYRRLGD